MTLQNKILTGLLIYGIWVALWFVLTMYVTGGNPSTWGRTMFALFGPVFGLFVAFLGALLVNDELEKEKKRGK